MRARGTKDFHYGLVGEQSDERVARHGICYGDGDGGDQLQPQPPGEDSFVAPGPHSDLHDPALTALAARMNASIREALPARPVPRAQVGFVLTQVGVMVVWDVIPTDAEWRDEYGSGEGLEHMSDKSDGELPGIFDLRPIGGQY